MQYWLDEHISSKYKIITILLTKLNLITFFVLFCLLQFFPKNKSLFSYLFDRCSQMCPACMFHNIKTYLSDLIERFQPFFHFVFLFLDFTCINFPFDSKNFLFLFQTRKNKRKQKKIIINNKN